MFAQSSASRWCTGAVISMAATATAFAQDNSFSTRDVRTIEDAPGYVEAVGDIASGREEEGRTRLLALLEADPTAPDRFMLAYNVACSYGRQGNLELGLEWLERAIEGGYGLFAGQMDALGRDPDLDALRPSSAFDDLVTLAAQHRKTLQATLAQGRPPFVTVPDPVLTEDGTPAPIPLVIVLHGYGVNPTSFARDQVGPWARDHGFAVMAPFGPELVARDTWAWSSLAGDFQLNFRGLARAVWTDMRKVLRDHPHIDPARIVIVGAGQGGSLAFALAARNPQWVRGAVILGGGLPPCTLEGWWRPSVHYGRRIDVVHSESDPFFPVDDVRGYTECLAESGLAIRFRAHGEANPLPSSLGPALDQSLTWIEEHPFERTAPDPSMLLAPGNAPTWPPEDGAPAKADDVPTPRRDGGDRP